MQLVSLCDFYESHDDKFSYATSFFAEIRLRLEAVAQSAIDGDAADAAFADLVLIGGVGIQRQVLRQGRADAEPGLHRRTIPTEPEIVAEENLAAADDAMQHIGLGVERHQLVGVSVEGLRQARAEATGKLVLVAEVDREVINVFLAVEHQPLIDQLCLWLEHEAVAEGDRVAGLD